MQKKISLVTAVFLCVTVCIVSVLGTILLTQGQYMSAVEKYQAALKMYDILEFYDQSYVGEFDPEEAQTIALKYLVAGTGDKYGYYYTPEELEELMNQQTGNMVGIGVMIVQPEEGDEGIVISHVIPNSPAEGAKLQSGDIIVGVDGVSFEESDYNTLAGMIAGEMDTEVTVKISRNGSTFDATMKRAEVALETVVYSLDEKTKTGVIRIIEFIENTPSQFVNAINSLKNQGAERFIFDLRDNPGGLLDSVLTMMESLLPKDSLITSLVKKSGAKQDYKTKIGNNFDYPCAVLINGNSASASELFTSALRDHGKAVIIGENSYGKGVGQGIYPLNDGSALKITDFFYNPPCGENFDGVGIAPNYEVKPAEGEVIDYFNIDFNDTVIAKAIEILTKQ